MPRSTYLALIGSTLLVVTGCGREPTDSQASAESTPAMPAPEATAAEKRDGIVGKDIAWFDGDVETAFAAARDQGKPLFLYWGAEWCPPCHQIKDQIFSKPEFVAKSRLFVPVYLDGDTDRAQKYGDQFGVMGYPTIIVFSPYGVELTRIPGGLDIGLYADVLDLTLEGVRPVSEIVAALMQGSAATEDDYRLLGFYSWAQDNERALEGYDKVDAFRTMADGCPDRLAAASARLYAEYIRAAIAAEKDEENPRPMSAAQKGAALERINLILAEDELSRASLPLLIGYADDVVPGLTDAGTPERDKLVADWSARLDAIAADPDTSVADRLWTRYVRLQFAKLDSDELPQTVVDQARADVDQADKDAVTVYQRQAFMNAAWYVLTTAGEREYVRELLLAELDRSKQPYYFMPNLARLAEDDGDYEEAIAWLRKGYETSRGTATRFQWGYYYVSGLVRMTPEDADGIAAAAGELLTELDGQQDVLYNRTGRTLKRLGKRLAEWNADGEYDDQIMAIQIKVDSLCANIPDGDRSPDTCEIFVDEA
jgi:thiol-disulfide isomerase/thioredoxin